MAKKIFIATGQGVRPSQWPRGPGHLVVDGDPLEDNSPVAIPT